MKTEQSNRILIGTGALTWRREERLTDRYGSVMMDTHSSFDQQIADKATLYLATIKKYCGQYGQLVCEVLETRKSTHIGDLHRDIKPSTPEVGDMITLGTGKLFHEHRDGVDNVGLVGNRETDWLNPRMLYRVHEQTVNLYFEPISKSKYSNNKR